MLITLVLILAFSGSVALATIAITAFKPNTDVTVAGVYLLVGNMILFPLGVKVLIDVIQGDLDLGLVFKCEVTFLLVFLLIGLFVYWYVDKQRTTECGCHTCHTCHTSRGTAND